LRDLLLSPALGASQLYLDGVDLNCCEGVVENCRRLGERAEVDEGIERALRAVQMPVDGQLDKGGGLSV
jgi:hypothetical protein